MPPWTRRASGATTSGRSNSAAGQPHSADRPPPLSQPRPAGRPRPLPRPRPTSDSPDSSSVAIIQSAGIVLYHCHHRPASSSVATMSWSRPPLRPPPAGRPRPPLRPPPVLCALGSQLGKVAALLEVQVPPNITFHICNDTRVEPPPPASAASSADTFWLPGGGLSYKQSPCPPLRCFAFVTRPSPGRAMS